MKNLSFVGYLGPASSPRHSVDYVGINGKLCSRHPNPVVTMLHLLPFIQRLAHIAVSQEDSAICMFQQPFSFLTIAKLWSIHHQLAGAVQTVCDLNLNLLLLALVPFYYIHSVPSDCFSFIAVAFAQLPSLMSAFPLQSTLNSPPSVIHSMKGSKLPGSNIAAPAGLKAVAISRNLIRNENNDPRAPMNCKSCRRRKVRLD